MKNATIEDWFDEMVGEANIINRFAGVRMEDIKGKFVHVQLPENLHLSDPRTGKHFLRHTKYFECQISREQAFRDAKLFLE